MGEDCCAVYECSISCVVVVPQVTQKGSDNCRVLTFMASL